MRQSLRILHVTPYFTDAWAYGGIPRLAHAITRALARRGHAVTVCTTDARDGRRRLPRPYAFRTESGVDVRVFPNLSNWAAYRQCFAPVGLGRFLRAHAAGFDVAHLHACRNVPVIVAARALRRAAVPYLVAPNGTAPRIERRRAAKAVFDAIERGRLVGGASTLLAVTRAEARQFDALGIDARRVRVVPNPIDLDEFAVPVARGRFRARFGLGERPIILYLGTLTPRKRVDVLLRAFAILDPAVRRDARLVVAGNDMGSGPSLRRLASALGVTSCTLFAGLQRGAERLEALADATVVAYPSQDEIFGLVPLEAIMSGTPVIVSGDSGCAEVIGSTGGGAIVPVGDAAALSTELARALASNEQCRAGVHAAALRVRALYSGDAVAAALESIYFEMSGIPVRREKAS